MIRKFFLLIIISFIFPCLADLSSDTVYLTWKQSPCTTMTIQWLSTLEQSENKIYYREKSDSRWWEAGGTHSPFPQTLNYLIHQVELVNLKPNTEYVFRLKTGSQEHLFRTMPMKPETPIRFVVGGDMYHDGVDLLCSTSKQAALFNPHFAVVGGDIAYASRSKPNRPQKIERWIRWIQCWHQNMVTPQGHLIPVIATIGNHDVSGGYGQTPSQARIFTGLFPRKDPEIYSAVDFGSYLTIFLLDSGHATSVGGIQTDWLKTSLNRRQHMINRFAVYHVPAYSSVRPFNNELSAAVRKHWLPCFEEGGIQTAFEHHDHAYKRTYPLLKNNIHPEGIVYLGDGAWGVSRPRRPKNGRIKRPYLAKFASVRHFIGVILQNDRQTFICIDSQGEKVDEYTRKIHSF